MQREGNSNCAHWIAARTRSLASRTAASGSPTIDMRGKPPARCTSTVTAGADTPSRARLCTSARPMAAASARRRGFERLHLAFERFELLARAQQHRALHVEFLAGDQVEPRQSRLQHGFEVLLQLLAALAQ